MSETSSNKMHLVIGGILLLIGVFVVVALIVVYSQAESDTTTVSITNVNPTVDSHYTNATSTYSGSDYWTTLTLTSGSITTIYINGVVSDANGEDDINDVDMTLYRSAVTNACSADVNDCYIVSNCSLTANDSDSKYYSCTADIAYYADSTGAGGPYPEQTWEAKLMVNDKNSGSGNSTKTAMEVASMLSLNIPETGIAYGTLASDTSTVASNNQVSPFHIGCLDT